MKLTQLATLCIAGILGLPSIALANPTAEARIEGRLQNIQQRITDGVNNGTINGQEYTRLEPRHDAIARQFSTDKNSGGSLDLSEVNSLEQQLDNLSYFVNQARHN